MRVSDACVFTKEEYIREGVVGAQVSYQDNTPTLELLLNVSCFSGLAILNSL